MGNSTPLMEKFMYIYILRYSFCELLSMSKHFPFIYKDLTAMLASIRRRVHCLLDCKEELQDKGKTRFLLHQLLFFQSLSFPLFSLDFTVLCLISNSPRPLPSSKYCLGLYETESVVGVSKSAGGGVEVLVVPGMFLSVQVARALLLYVFISVWIRYLFSYSSTGLYSVRLA